MSEIFYSQIISAKDGNLIPLCKNRATNQEVALHSKYNPVREAEAFAATVNDDCLFFVVLGLGGGYHIEKLIEKVPASKILVVETSKSSLSFLEQIPTVKKISGKKNIIMTSIENLEETLLFSYKPALHGNLTILSLRSWEGFFKEEASLAREKINAAIKLLAADYSVQSHFGKIWQKNILTNLSLAERAKSFSEIKKAIFPILSRKKAAIIAAGPSLDDSIKELKKNRGEYFIIATDTAFSALEKQGLSCDAVISIDGQSISRAHYQGKLPSDTIYFFDLCACPSAIRKVLTKSENLVLTESGHPLAQYASFFSGKQNFPHIEAGSGTVTIAAYSLAKKIGFKDTVFFGADFAYFSGRPYTRGTYLENQFYSTSNRFKTAEKAYTALTYRTPVIKLAGNKITTEILEAYRLSLNDFIHKPRQKTSEAEEGRFNLRDFKEKYRKELKKAFSNENDFDENSPAVMTLLPLCAKLGKNSAFLAYLNTLRYTEQV